MQAMTYTRTLLCDSSVKPTTHEPAHTLQIQIRCYILALPPVSSPHLSCLPPFGKTAEIKLQKTYNWNGFLHRCWREKHITSYVSIHRISLSLYLFFPFWFDRRSKWGIPHALVLRRGITSTLLSSSFPLSHQNDSFFYYGDERVKWAI